MPIDPITDEVLLNAVRKRLLQELLREQQSNTTIQNIVGGGQQPAPDGMAPQGMAPPSQEGMDPGGMLGGMEQPPPAPEDFEYGVDITRTKMWPGVEVGQYPTPEEGQEMPDPIGWHKTVRRFRTPRGNEIERKKKL